MKAQHGDGVSEYAYQWPTDENQLDIKYWVILTFSFYTKEGNALFNNALGTFHYMASDILLMTTQCTDMIMHIMAFVKPVV